MQNCYISSLLAEELEVECKNLWYLSHLGYKQYSRVQGIKT
jgi:hypothetical protein